MERENDVKQIPAQIAALLTARPIETPRLLLRPFRQGDLADLYEYLSQREQQRLAGNCPCDSMEDARLSLEYNMSPDHPQVYFAVVLKSENKLIGNLTFNPSYLAQDEALSALRGVTLSYVLNERYWRRGLMTELLQAVYPVLFEQVKLDYIQSGFFDFNGASAALQRKLGMQLWTEAQFETDGKTIQTKEMILFRKDWLAMAGKWPENTDYTENCS
jgi:ribosomal-protein-alanine N-acetyltransferase